MPIGVNSEEKGEYTDEIFSGSKWFEPHTGIPALALYTENIKYFG